MVTIEYKNSVGHVYFDGGLTEDGKIIRKSKTYRNIARNVSVENLYKALEQLGKLSDLPVISAEIVESSSLVN